MPDTPTPPDFDPLKPPAVMSLTYDWHQIQEILLHHAKAGGGAPETAHVQLVRSADETPSARVYWYVP